MSVRSSRKQVSQSCGADIRENFCSVSPAHLMTMLCFARAAMTQVYIQRALNLTARKNSKARPHELELDA